MALCGRLNTAHIVQHDSDVVGLDEDQRILQDQIPAVKGAGPEDRAANAVHAENLSKRYALEGGGSVQVHFGRHPMTTKQ